MKTKLLLLLLLANFSIYAQNTAIPDLNFEKKLILLGIDSGTPDGQVLTSNISGVTTLNVSSSQISNLTGIEGFTALKDLNCNDNYSLASVNLSKNIALEKASFVRCPLTSIDVTSNVNLVDLNVAVGGSTTGKEGTGNLTALDLSHNPKLKNLNCSHHKIANLNFASNPLLESLDCGGNKNTTLDLSQNLALKKLVLTNSLLLKTIDLSRNTKLVAVDFSENVFESIDLSKNTELTQVECRSSKTLEQINLKNGKNSLIVASLLRLINNPSLYCVLVDDVAYSQANWKTNIDNSVTFSSTCVAPKYTLIPDIEFERALIVSGIDGKEDGKVLTSRVSDVKTLDYKYSTYLKITDLTGIEDFVSLETLNTPGTKMGKLNISKNINLKYLNCSSENLSALDISNNKNLISLNLSNNKINSLDLTKHTQLKELNFGSNNFTEINLSNNPLLTTLMCYSNKLSTLDLSKNLALQIVNCGDNSLTAVDFSLNTELTNIVCYINNISELNVTKNTALKSLITSQTNISTLDLSKNTALTNLDLSSIKPLTSVNLKNGKNTLLTTVNIKQNPLLSCVSVDDVAFAETTWKNKEIWTTYALTCGEPAYTSIPDPAFESALIDAGYDVVLDGKILTARAAAIKTLNLQSKGSIADLTGIEDFIGLESLTTPSIGISLKSVNLSKNIALNTLIVNNSQFASLDLSTNKALTKLEVTNNKSLKELNLQNKNNSILTATNLNLTNNATLACILVDDPAYSNTNWTSKKDNWATFNTVCSPPKYTSIPDIEFEKVLINAGIDDVQDGKVLTSRIAIEKKIDYRSTNYNKITDLTGIEDFAALEFLSTPSTLTKLDVTKNTALKTLNCSVLNLTELDLTNNPNLVTLNCGGNKFTTLNLSKNLALESLDVTSSSLKSLDLQNNVNLTSLIITLNLNLTSIDISKNTKLTTLEANRTGIQSLDVSANTKLTSIACQNNRIVYLDVSKNPLLTSLTCQTNSLKSLNLNNGNNKLLGTNLNFKSNPSLTCIQVDDVSYANANWSTFKDATASYNLDCTTYTLIPDSNFEDKLIALKIDKDGKNGKVATTSIVGITSLDVSSSSIKDLTGIQDFAALKILNCSTNQLTSLNPASNPLLTELKVSNNTLTTLDVSKNASLAVLDCSYNTITVIDVSKNPALTALNVSNNNLNSLNVKNGFNVNMDWFSVNFTKNPSLTCIQVDNAKYSNDNWNGKLDKTSFFTENCGSYTLIPDSNFEDKLIELKIDIDGKNGKVLTSTIASVKDLNVQLSDIKDLTGIQDFTSLEFLNCQFNLLTTLNVAKNSKLIELYTHGNDLTTLDVSANTALTTLQVNKNKLTALDISKNSKLVYINVMENKLKTLNLNNNNNINFTSALLSLNPTLSCIKVDSPSFAGSSNVFFKDATASYSATCSLGLEDSIFNKVIMYPNPTKGEVNINNVSLEKASVYNSLGQLVKSFILNSANTDHIVNLSGLPKGVYYVYLINGDAASAKKVIVE